MHIPFFKFLSSIIFRVEQVKPTPLPGPFLLYVVDSRYPHLELRIRIGFTEPCGTNEEEVGLLSWCRLRDAPRMRRTWVGK